MGGSDSLGERVLALVTQPPQPECVPSPRPGDAAARAIEDAANRAALAAGTLALPPGPLGWATIHTMAAFHYAQLYWRPGRAGAPCKGLDFPGDDAPDGWDFIYFAFVIGLAAQTADVTIPGRRMNPISAAPLSTASTCSAVVPSRRRNSTSGAAARKRRRMAGSGAAIRTLRGLGYMLEEEA